MTERIIEMMDVAIYGGTLQQVPNADKIHEEIVRCRDCEHYRDHELIPIENAPDLCMRIPYGVNTEPDGFCKWGEKKH